METNQFDKTIDIDIKDEMEKSYIDYSMSVIVGRALPDVRDGLKPVHRRILYAMDESGNTADKSYRKSARSVGDVMGNYHPHGDSAIYDALARMAQDWSLRVPLIDGQGNFGSMDPDPPASMRYTEARLAKVSKSSEEFSRDVGLYYNPISPADADKLSPNFPFTKLFESQGVAVPAMFSLSVPAYHAEVSKMLAEVPAAQWKSYLRFHLGDSASPFLSDAFVQENFNF